MKTTFHPTRNLGRPACALTTIAAAVVLAACGSGGDPAQPVLPPASAVDAVAAQVAVTGTVTIAASYVSGALACYDLDDNGACDDGEPTAVSAADGRFTLTVEAAEVGRHATLAIAPATTVDRESGAAIGAELVLAAPASGITEAHGVFVGTLSTAVVAAAAEMGLPLAEAEAAVQQRLGLGRSPLADPKAATDDASDRAARVLNTLATRTARLAADAGVPAPAASALVTSVASGHLAEVGVLLQASSGGAPLTAAAIAAQLLDDRNLRASTVAAQAESARVVAAGQPAASTGPFISLRRFTWTDANNYSVFAFMGDNTPDDDGRYWASDSRVTVADGHAQPFNRNTAYLDRDSGQWQVCDNSWHTVRSKAASAVAPQESVYCAGQLSRTRIGEVDVSGRRMTDVVAAMRAFPLRDAVGPDTDATGLPVKWGPDPKALGDAVFPSGSVLALRDQVTDIGNTERYSLTDKPRVQPAFRQAATLAELAHMAGNIVDAKAVVTNLNTVFLDDIAVVATDATLNPVRRYRVAFDPQRDAVRYYACDVLKSNGNSTNCKTVGNGSTSTEQLADSRVLRFGAGYPQALTQAFKRQRLFVERSGAVFGGNRDLERKVFQQRPNTVAWEALRQALAMPALPVPVAPQGPGAFVSLRSFAYTDAANYNWRLFAGDTSQTGADGWITVSDLRGIRSGGKDVAFTRDRLYWTGSDWYDCPSDGSGVLLVNSQAPNQSLYCKSYLDERFSDAVVTLDGRNMADVVRDIRLYSGRDFGTSYANWGPNPDVVTSLASQVFPPGSTMEYRGTLRRRTPVAIATAAGDQLRVAPDDASVPFDKWPFASSLDEFTAKYAGDLAGGALSGATAVVVASVNTTAPRPEYTTLMDLRVAFDPRGQKARFYLSYRLKSNNAAAGFSPVLDTTYNVETLGDARVLSFAALPTGFESGFGYARLFAERAGGVWLGFKDAVPAEPGYSIRLNGIAAEALGRALGLL